jgi:hypothetical protein
VVGLICSAFYVCFLSIIRLILCLNGEFVSQFWGIGDAGHIEAIDKGGTAAAAGLQGFQLAQGFVELAREVRLAAGDLVHLRLGREELLPLLPLEHGRELGLLALNAGGQVGGGTFQLRHFRRTAVDEILEDRFDAARRAKADDVQGKRILICA